MKPTQDVIALPDKLTDAQKLEMALEELRMGYAERRGAIIAPSQCRLILVELERLAHKGE